MKNDLNSDALSDIFLKYYHSYNDKKEEMELKFSNLSSFDDDNQEYLLDKDELEQIRRGADRALYDLYYQSVEDNYYFHDCPLSVYKNTYFKRFEQFKKYNIDAEEIDFLKDELAKIVSPSTYDRLICIFPYGEFLPNDLCFEISRNKKIEYLKEKILQLGWFCEEQTVQNLQVGFDSQFLQPTFTKIKKEEIIEELTPRKDKQLTSNQIVLLFDKIGFFSHPKIENISKIKQAKFLSSLTGLNEKNLKTHIAKLNKSPKSNGDNYIKDIDFTDLFFNDLTL